MDTFSQIGLPLLALVVGFVVAWLICHARARGNMEEVESRLRSVQASLSEKEQELAALQSDFDTEKSISNTLLSTKSMHEDRLKATRSSLSEVQDKLEQLQAELDAAQAHNSTLQEQLAQREDRLRELEAQLASTQDDMAGLTTALETEETYEGELETQLQDMADQARELEARLEAKHAQATELAATVSLLEDQVVYLEQDLAQARAQLQTRAASESAPAPRAVEPRAVEVSATTPSGLRTDDALRERERELAEAQEELRSLRYTLSALTALSADLAGSLEERDRTLEAALAHSSDEVKEILQEPGSTADALEALVVQFEAVNAAKLDLEGQLGRCQAQLVQLQEGLSASQAELEALVQEKRQMEALVQAYQAQLDNLEDQLGVLIGDLQPLMEQQEPEEEGIAEAGGEAIDEVEMAKIGMLGAGVAAALATIKNKDQALDEAEDNIILLQEQLESTSADHGELLATLQEKETSLSEAQTQADALQASLEERLAEIEALNEQLSGVQSELNDTQAARADLEARFQELDDQTAALQADLEPFLVGEEPPRDIERLSQESVESLAPEDVEPSKVPVARMGAVTAGVAGAVAAIKKRDEALEQAQAEIASLNDQLAVLTSERADLEAALQEKEAAVADLQGQVDTAQSDLAARSADIDTLQQQASGLQAELTEAENGKAQVQAELEAANQELDDVNSQIGDLQAKLRPLLGEDVAAIAEAEEPDRRVGKLAALAAGVTGAVAALHRKDGALDEAHSDMASLTEQLETLSTAKAHLETTLQEKEATLAELQSQVDALQADMDSRNVEIDGLRTQVSSLQAEADELNAKLEGVQAELESTQAAKAQVELELREADSQLDSLNSQIERLQSTLQPLLGEDLKLEAEPEEPGRKAVKMGALAAGVTGAAAAIRRKDDELSDAATQVVALNEQLADLASEKVALEARLQERESALTDVQVQMVDVSGRQEETLAQLQSREAELADTRGQLEETQALFKAAPAIADLARWFSELPPVKNAAANAAISQGALPYRSSKPQNLTRVRGIGSTFEQRLYRSGVGTFWELAHLPVEDFRRELNITDWQMLRLDLGATQQDARRLADQTGSVGAIWEALHVDDFESIEGIGQIYEKRLYEAGIYTYEALANATVEQLADICKAPKMRTPDYAQWIAKAAELKG